MRRAPGHISWNVWIAGAWRQMAIIQGEGLELSEVPLGEWTGLTHPGRIRFQTFRPRHGEPLTDALIGQGMMSLGGGGCGGGGLPYPGEVLQLWGGDLRKAEVAAPRPPTVVTDAGDARWEEINVGVAGGNCGWPHVEGEGKDLKYRNPIHACGRNEGTSITGGAFCREDSPWPEAYHGRVRRGAVTDSGWGERRGVSCHKTPVKRPPAG